MPSNVERKRNGQPLTVWELPKLLEPMHRWKRRKRGKRRAVWRPHFLPILAFVYRNRFAVASQIQRRFAKAMPSDRTARRQLAELEAAGCLSVADTRSTSPLFPKVFFVTGWGVRRIEESLRERGKPGACCRRDRRRPEAYSPDHVLHEILTTEFLLNVWQCCELNDQMELLTVQRRALERHKAFIVEDNWRRSRLKPDAMFVYRDTGGLTCCFLELDNGTMSLRKMRSKFTRYGDWARSSRGIEYLRGLYGSLGAVDPKPKFRVLVVTRHRLAGADHRRLESLLNLTTKLESRVGRRFCFATVNRLAKISSATLLLRDASWRRGHAPPV